MKRTAVFILVAAVLFVLLVSGCGPAPSPTPSPTPTLPPPTLTTSLRPIEIVSATGPHEPINPGGPIVEITAENVSIEPVILLEVTLEAGGTFVFHFDVSPSSPLLPGQSISERETLIGGGFGDTVPVPVTINGRLEGNVAFFYVRSVVITRPPG